MAGVLLAATPAHAETCLDRETITAARVHEFETMMMAVTLRCKAIGTDIGPVIEAMMGTHRPIFAAADRRTKAIPRNLATAMAGARLTLPTVTVSRKSPGNSPANPV